MSTAKDIIIVHTASREVRRSNSLKLTKIFTFDAGHFIPEHPTCGNQHGHTYILEVTISGRSDKDMIVDFKDLNGAVRKHILKKLDHKNLNKIKGLEIPTAENLAKWIWRRLKNVCANELRVKLREIKVWETRTSAVTYYGR